MTVAVKLFYQLGLSRFQDERIFIPYLFIWKAFLAYGEMNDQVKKNVVH